MPLGSRSAMHPMTPTTRSSKKSSLSVFGHRFKARYKKNVRPIIWLTLFKRKILVNYLTKTSPKYWKTFPAFKLRVKLVLVLVYRFAVQAPTLPKKAIKILLNLALIAKEALVRGGQLDVGAEQGDTGIEVVIRAAGQKVVLDDGIRSALEGGIADDDLTARTAAAWMSRELAIQNGGDLRISPASDSELLLGSIVNG